MKELGEFLELVAEGKLNPVVEEKPMSQLPRAVGEMKEERVMGRLAFVPELKKQGGSVRGLV